MIVAGYYGFTLVVRVYLHLSVVHLYFRFQMITSVNVNGFFSKLGMCIDIMEIWFGIANGQISSIFDGVICPRHVRVFIAKQ